MRVWSTKHHYHTITITSNSTTIYHLMRWSVCFQRGPKDFALHTNFIFAIGATQSGKCNYACWQIIRLDLNVVLWIKVIPYSVLWDHLEVCYGWCMRVNCAVFQMKYIIWFWKCGSFIGTICNRTKSDACRWWMPIFGK